MPLTSLMLALGTYCRRASVMSGESVRVIWLASTMLRLAGTLSPGIPELGNGVVG